MMIGLLCVIVLRADDCVHFSVLLFERHCNVWETLALWWQTLFLNLGVIQFVYIFDLALWKYG